MNYQRDIRFMLTPSHPCSYLPDRQARTLFLEPHTKPDQQLYAALSQMGFRRSGEHIYRPNCVDCRACVPIRIPVQDFKARRSQRRIMKRNADLNIRVTPAQFTPEHYRLYARYLSARHQDGDMFPPTEDQFRSFLLANWTDSWFVEIRSQETLVAVAVTDRLNEGLSAIYTFFDPELSKKSLGTFCILQQIELTRHLELSHLYLGYWIAQSEKMAYKTDYRPFQSFDGERWNTSEDAPGEPLQACLSYN